MLKLRMNAFGGRSHGFVKARARMLATVATPTWLTLVASPTEKARRMVGGPLTVIVMTVEWTSSETAMFQVRAATKMDTTPALMAMVMAVGWRIAVVVMLTVTVIKDMAVTCMARVMTAAQTMVAAVMLMVMSAMVVQDMDKALAIMARAWGTWT